MLVYRIVHKMYSSSLFASGMQGRWNSAGNKVLYAAESIPLAFLENMVRRQGVGFNNDFQIMFISIPDPVSIEVINLVELGMTWRNPNDYSACLPLGDKWFREGKSLVLKVPSAVMPEASNYVINTFHQDYGKVKLAGVTNLVPDPRIDDILKRYR
ncbi:RES family NAD+ phosphorylase [Dyadobacter psychrotolerans]|uniref:RES domain-containing protein n=1 Tax=Dyadobacter psychrotolerans TaxID=2541721 RepID=A0A4R5DFM5_9BACT|nr:RES family NAD+ phosphorylase [Dyadobacter psychrotolerans]TDE10574.1 RES domain-containing protein [Dyadobacter psychrotolerans]